LRLVLRNHLIIQFQWVQALTKITEQYKDSFVPDYYNLLSRYYSENDGPFLIGNEITYADFVVYCSIDNDDRIGTLPVSKYSLP
jgi:glutathione S-transferase